MTCPRCRFENPESARVCGSCGAELEAPAPGTFAGTRTFQTPTRDLGRGTTFAGRYEVIELVGQGGMGTVYKVYDTKLREKVALKLLRPEIARTGKRSSASATRSVSPAGSPTATSAGCTTWARRA